MKKGFVKKHWKLGLLFILGWATGATASTLNHTDLPKLVDIGTILWGVRLLALGLLLAGAYFAYTASQTHKEYELVDEDEEDLLDQVSNKMYRSLEYAIILINCVSALVIMSLFVSMQLVSDGKIPLVDSLVDAGLFAILLMANYIVLKLIHKIRNYKLSIFSTFEDVKAYLDSYDEGEKQASYEMSQWIVFTMNQLVLPSLYGVLLVISAILKEQQLVAYLVVVFIHLYINIMQYRMVRQYFK
ncbi:TPA: DUF3169 family protein [Streptococcus suis]|nr:DUF3169 family protein [Streptococcus suis]